MAGDEKNQPSELETKLGIDEIKDSDKREVVKNYFEKTLTTEQRESLIHENAKTELAKLRQKMRSLNERGASIEEFVNQIIETTQKDVLERDLNEGYTDQNGSHTSYVDQYLMLVGVGDGEMKNNPEVAKYKGKGYSMDWDTKATFDYCLDKFKNTIRSVPANVKRDVRHQFALQFLQSFAKTLDDADSAWTNFDYSDISKMEQKFATTFPYLQNFNAWLAYKGMTMEDASYQYTKIDTKAIVDTKAKLETDKKGLADFSKPEQEYYNAQIKEIEGLALTNPSQAQERTATLEADMALLTPFMAFSKDLTDLRSKYDDAKGKYDDIDPKMDDQIKDLQKQYDQRVKDLDAEKSPQKRASLMNLSADLQKTKDKISFDLVKFTESKAKSADVPKDPNAPTDPNAAPADAENPAVPEAKPGPVDAAVMGDPKLQEIVKKLGKIPLIGGFILGIFQLAPSTLKTLGINVSSDLGDFFKGQNTPKTPEQLAEIDKKAKSLLKDKFKIQSISELKNLADTKLKDFLKKRPEDFDKKRYDAFVTALKKNDAEKVTDDQKTFEFFLTKIDTWKD